MEDRQSNMLSINPESKASHREKRAYVIDWKILRNKHLQISQLVWEYNGTKWFPVTY